MDTEPNLFTHYEATVDYASKVICFRTYFKLWLIFFHFLLYHTLPSLHTPTHTQVDAVEFEALTNAIKGRRKVMVVVVVVMVMVKVVVVVMASGDGGDGDGFW